MSMIIADTTFTLHDDDSTRKKHTVMNKWCVCIDDERQPEDFKTLEDILDDKLEWGKAYRITFTEVPTQEERIQQRLLDILNERLT